MQCLVCESNKGDKRISPGPSIYETKFWIVEHCYPSKIEGWLVLVLKRHEKSLHNVTEEEFLDLGKLQHKTTRVISKRFQSQKEYLACFSEQNHFEHIHFHVIPRPNNLQSSNKGPKLFSNYMKKNLSKTTVKKLCEELKRLFENLTEF